MLFFFLKHITIKRLRLEKYKKIEGNIIKYVRDLFRLKKEIDGTSINDVRNLLYRKNK